jgi:hypothetical protein
MAFAYILSLCLKKITGRGKEARHILWSSQTAEIQRAVLYLLLSDSAMPLFKERKKTFNGK